MVWVYVCDLIFPNINQGPEIISNVEDRPAFNRAPWMTWWDIPVDDTHNIRIGYWYGPEDADVQVVHGFGQMGDRPYEERQRAPGDYDAQVSQRPIAVHALKHLAISDRGVILMRNAVRQGIQAVHNGEDPKGIFRTEGLAIPTYDHNRMLHVPPAPAPEEDRRLLREIARSVAEEYIRNPMQA